MRSGYLKLWLSLLLALLLAGCAGMMNSPQPLTFTPEGFPSGKYMAKAENVQFIVDASQTMGNNGQQDFVSAKNFVNAVNWSLPADFAANVGLRSFGHSERQSPALTELAAPMARYSRDEIKKGLDKVKYAGGNSPLGAAIDAASADLDKAAGKSVLVIVSDGTQNNMDDALGAAQRIKAKMGDRLCVYTVWVGNDLVGQKYLEQVAKAFGCGAAETGMALTDKKTLAAFIEKAFLERKPEAAGVAAAGTVAAPGAAAATDAAAATGTAPATAKEVISFNLLFDFDKADIRSDMVPVLEQAKTILNEDPAATYTVSGHACNIGTDAYNQQLSERRAAAVKSWLVANGIAASRLETVGYGEGSPKYDNNTREGRKLNRRVEIQTK